MPSGRCANLCAKTPKTVRMYLDNDKRPIYLCAPCARELGYQEKTNG